MDMIGPDEETTLERVRDAGLEHIVKVVFERSEWIGYVRNDGQVLALKFATIVADVDVSEWMLRAFDAGAMPFPKTIPGVTKFSEET